MTVSLTRSEGKTAQLVVYGSVSRLGWTLEVKCHDPFLNFPRLWHYVCPTHPVRMDRYDEESSAVVTKGQSKVSSCVFIVWVSNAVMVDIDIVWFGKNLDSYGVHCRLKIQLGVKKKRNKFHAVMFHLRVFMTRPINVLKRTCIKAQMLIYKWVQIAVRKHQTKLQTQISKCGKCRSLL